MSLHTRAGAGAEVLGVNWSERIVSVIVVPWEQPTLVEHHGEIWEEVFSKGAFDSLAGTDAQRIRVNREHARADAIGKALAFRTRDPRGLIAELRIARTQRGDDSLALASENMLSASAGFIVKPGGVIVDRARRARRITSAYLDHIALVMQPAYDGAEVLAVRTATPNLDELTNDPIFAWAKLRTDPLFVWARRRSEK
jgi:HK97 family phage prohead protease